MRNVILIICTIVIFIIFNYAVYEKQQILSDGDIVLLKISPMDPRSIMQGDYIAFKYAIEEEMENEVKNPQMRGYAVIKPGPDRVAHFVRIYQGEALADDEKIIKYQYNSELSHRYVIRPSSFIFQEGLGPLYQKAEYAIFHYRGSQHYLLVGMADKNKVEIENDNEKTELNSNAE